MRMWDDKILQVERIVFVALVQLLLMPISLSKSSRKGAIHSCMDISSDRGNQHVTCKLIPSLDKSSLQKDDFLAHSSLE